MSDEYKGAIAIAFEVIGNEKYMMPTDARLILAHALIAMNNVRLAGPGLPVGWIATHDDAEKTVHLSRAKGWKVEAVAFEGAGPGDGDKHWSAVRERVKTLELALVEIMKGEGAFSRNQLEHATNCIESMKRIASDALYSSGATTLTERK